MAVSHKCAMTVHEAAARDETTAADEAMSVSGDEPVTARKTVAT
jgi:hypothetical protein